MALLALTVGFVLACASPAAAQVTYVVNSAVADVGDPDATPDGVCDSGGGVCTLREAIEETNGNANAPLVDLIEFDPLLTGPIVLTLGELVILDDVEIRGPGAALMTVSGDNVFRVFRIGSGSTFGLFVTISGLTISDGVAPSGEDGGGILNLGQNLTLSNVILQDNHADDAFDGGGGLASILNCGLYDVTISDSLIQNNTTSVAGGGVYICEADRLVVEHTTFLLNTALAGGGIAVQAASGPITFDSVDVSSNEAGDVGGGILIGFPFGAVTIENSTIAGNSALGFEGYGGGFALGALATQLTIRGTTIAGNLADYGAGADLELNGQPALIENSTISGNLAALSGGGLYVFDGDQLTISHSTIASNGAGNEGGGIVADNCGCSLSSVLPLLSNTIVGDNTAPSDRDLMGEFDALYSLIENPDTAIVNDVGPGGTTNLSGDPQLDALANNGGPTQTHRLQPLSPAIDAGNPLLLSGPFFDQRGVGFLRFQGGVIDIGAFEMDVNDPPVSAPDTLTSVAEDSPQLTIPFSALLANDGPGGGGEEAGQTLTIVTPVTALSGGTVTISGTDVLFTPAADFNGTASFSYTVRDDGQTHGVDDFKTAIGLVTFTITAVNDPPVSAPDSLTSVAEDSPQFPIPFGDLLANDGPGGAADELGQTLVVQVVGVPVGGTAIVSGTDVLFTPAADFNGTASFTYSVTDNGQTNGVDDFETGGTVTVLFTITPVADTPAISDATTFEDIQTTSGLQITLNAAVPCDVTHLKITGITGGTLYLNNGTTVVSNDTFLTIAQAMPGFKFTPDPNQSDATTPPPVFGFNIQASTGGTDAGLGGLPVTATITVNPVADTPVVPLTTATPINTQSGPIVIAPNAADGAEVTHFQITNIQNGTLFQFDGVTGIAAGAFVTLADVTDGLKFTPGLNLSNPTTFGFDVQAAIGAVPGGAVVTVPVSVTCEATVAVKNGTDADPDSLRDAIARVCAGGTITFDPVAFPAATSPYAITLASELTITKSVTIVGPVPALVTVTGNDTFRLMNITGAGVDVSIANLSFTGGGPQSGANAAAIEFNNAGLLTLTNCDIHGNTAPSAFTLYSNASTGLSIAACTFRDNTSESTVKVDGTPTTIVNSTFTGNSGSALYNSNSKATVTNTTIVGASPFGIIADGPTASVTVTNTLLSHSDNLQAFNSATLISGGHNLLDDASVFDVPHATDIYVAPGATGIGPLAANGGRNLTHALLPGSPALDAGDDCVTQVSGCLAVPLTTDQRGTGFGRQRDAADANTTQTVDIGAFEADPMVEAIGNQTTTEDTAVPLITFNVGDASTPFDAITATSSDTTLVPNANLVVGPDTPSTRTLSITPAADRNGTTTITVTATKTISGTVVTSTDTFDLTVTAVNDPPVPAADSLPAVAEDAAPIVIPFALLLANDGKGGGADESGQTLTITLVHSPTGGSVSILGTDVIFTPDADFNGNASFSYRVQDNGVPVQEADGSVSFAITAVNDAPTAFSGTLSLSFEDTGDRTFAFADLLVNHGPGGGADESGQALTITAVTNGTGGTVAIVGTDVIFTPAAHFHGVASFSYTVQDDGQTNGVDEFGTATGTLSFTVEPVADTPIVPVGTTTTINTQTGPIAILRNSADGAEVTHFFVTNIQNGLLFHADTTTGIAANTFVTVAEAAGLRFTPGTNLSNPTPFGFDVQASIGGSLAGLAGGIVTASISVTCEATVAVKNVLDAGTDSLRDAIARVCAGGTITFDPVAFGAAGSPYAIALATELVITKSVTIVGPTSAIVTLTGNGTFRLMSISGAGVNVTIQNLSFTGGGPQTGANATAIEFNDAGTLTLDNCEVYGNTSPTSNAVYTHASAGISIAGCTFRDNVVGTAEVFVDITPLRIVNTTLTGGFGAGLFVVNVAASVTNSTIARNGTGIYATDPSAVVTVTNTLFDLNGATLISDNGASITSGGHNLIDWLNTFDVPHATDIVVPIFATGLAPLAANGGRNLTHALLPGSPALDAGDSTAATTAGLATDGRGAGFLRILDAADPDTTAVVDIGAFEANPIVENIANKTTAEDSALPTFTFNIGDASTAFDSITATSSDTTLVPNANLVVGPDTPSTRTLSIAPAAERNGVATITVTATKTISGTVVTSSDTFDVTVTAVNDPPVPAADTLPAVPEDSSPIVIPVALLLSNDGRGGGPDENGQTLTITAVTPGTGGTVAISGSGTEVIFTPTLDFNGTASFTYTVFDNGQTNGGNDFKNADGSASFLITSVNDAPVAGADTLSAIAEDSGDRTIPLASLTGGPGGGADEIGQTRTITAVTPGTGGTVAVSGSGTDVIFTPALNFHGVASFTYTVQDNGQTNGAPAFKTATGTVSFDVLPVADTPIVPVGTTTTINTQTGPIAIARNAADGAEVTHFQVSNFQNGTLFHANGTTGIAPGTFVTVAEAAGLRFTPGNNLSDPTPFGFAVQAAIGAVLGGGVATVGISVTCEATVAVKNVLDAGPDSLRDAIARVCPGGTITFDPAAFGPVGSPYTITLASELAIAKNLTIAGPTASRVTVSGNHATRVLHIVSGTVAISNLAISNGSFVGGAGGGGIKNVGTLTLTNCTIAGNTVTDAVHAPGGGIENDGTLTVVGCTISGNTATGTSGGFGVGGGIYNAGTATIINSTISGNTASSAGGGMFTGGSLPTVITNSTITNNTSGLGGNGINASGDPGIVTLRNTIVANSGNGGADVNSAAFTSQGHNLIGRAPAGMTGLTHGVNGDLVGTDGAPIDARLSPLANNGGPTFTHALLNDSPALDAGDDCVTQASGCLATPLTTDQRGTSFARQLDAADANTTQTVDIGAFEANPVVENVGNKTTAEDVPLPAVTFNIGDASTAFDSITATSNNVSLVPNVGLVVGPDTPSTRTLSITPAADRNGVATITVTATKTISGTVVTSSDTFDVTVTAVNDPPVPVADTMPAVPEDSSPIVIPFALLLANDGRGGGPDENGQTLTISQVTNGTGGTVAILGTDVIFTPTASFSGAASFSYTVQDNGQTNGGNDFKTAATTVGFAISAVNDPPVAGADSLTAIAEDSGNRTIALAALLTNDGPGGGADESGQTLTITQVTNGTGGTVAIVGTDVIFTPAANFGGAASFTYTVQDNGQTNEADDFKTATGTVSFDVTPVNDPPVPAADSLPAVAEDAAPIVIPLALLLGNDGPGGGADEIGQTLTVTQVTNGTGGTVAIVGTDVVFTPAADFHGAASFTYTVQDNGQTNGANDFKTAIGTVGFVITAVNDAPVAGADTLPAIAEDSGNQAIALATLLANDGPGGGADEIGQTLTITQVTNGTGGTVAIVGTDVVFTPAADFAGAASFTYTVQDNGQTDGVNDFKTATGTVSFTITAVNDAPVAGADSLPAIAEDSGQRTIAFAALLPNDGPGGGADEIGQTLTITQVTSGTGGTVAIVGTDVIFTPAADFAGAASFTYTVQDNGQTNGVNDFKTAPATVSFTITAVNDAPVAGADTLPAIAEDSGNRTITLASLLANDSPGGANEGGQTLTITQVANGTGGTVAIVGTDVIFTPAPDFNGAASFTYTVQDDGQTNGVNDFKTATGTVTFTITAVNDAPVAVADTLPAVAEDSGARTIAFATLLANDGRGGGADENGQTLTITQVANGTGGTVAIVGTDVVFTPALDFNGAASFTYTVQDNGQTNGADDFKTATGTVGFAITAVNDAPVAAADTLSAIAEDSGARTIAFAALVANDGRGGGADESGQTLTITQVASGTGGTVAIVGTDVIFTPALDFNGAASFTYTVQDNGQTNGADDFKTATGTVGFAITAVNDAPTIAPVADRVTPLNTPVGPLPVTVGDVDNDVAGLVLTAESSNPTLMPDTNIVLGGAGADRTISMTPMFGQAGSTVVKLTVGDGALTSVTQFTLSVGTDGAVTITVQTPNGTPSFVSDTSVVTLTGTASSSLPVTQVRWTSDRGGQGIAAVEEQGGPTSLKWTAKILLEAGANVLTFVAQDSVGRTASAAVTAHVNALNYYFAEGATGAFFDTYFLIANPGDQAAEVRATYMTEAGTSVIDTFTVPAHTRVSRLADAVAGLDNRAFSTTITSTNGVPLLVERAMYWDASAYGGSAAAAAEQLSRTWYFGDGSEGGPPPFDPARAFDTYVLLSNPGAAPANVTVQFLTEQSEVVTRTTTVPAGGRATIPTIGIAELDRRSFGIVVTSDQPIVAERSQYFGSGYAAGHVSPGMPSLSSVWRFAEGTTGPTFDTYFLVVNPHATPVTLGITYRLADERRIFITRELPALSRATIRVGDTVPSDTNQEFWTTITSDRPVAVDRSMYWPMPSAAWTGSHGSAGVDSPALKWGFAEGFIGGSMQFETYLLLANPGDTDAAVEVTFLLANGGTVVRNTTITAQQRTTLDVAIVAPELVNQSFGMLVRSTNGVPIVAERSMYWTAQGVRRAEGSNATGIRIP